MPCEQGIRESCVDLSLTRPLQTPNEHFTTPKDALQIDLVTKLPPSDSFGNIVTAMDVFSRYLFAYPTSNQDAKTLAKVISIIGTKHTYLPTALVSDEGSAFMSHVVKEVAGGLWITLKDATTRQAQSDGMIERYHASIKQALKIETGKQSSLWHQYVSIAVPNYNKSSHASVGCEPRRVFHGRILYFVLVLKKAFFQKK